LSKPFVFKKPALKLASSIIAFYKIINNPDYNKNGVLK